MYPSTNINAKNNSLFLDQHIQPNPPTTTRQYQGTASDGEGEGEGESA